MEILVPQKYTVKQVKRAEAKRDEFKPSRYTSGCANVDDMVATGRAVILCETHSRKFSPEKARYRRHPDKAFFKGIRGACDWCKAQSGLAFLYLNERDAFEEERKAQKFQRALEYGRLITG